MQLSKIKKERKKRKKVLHILKDYDNINLGHYECVAEMAPWSSG